MSANSQLYQTFSHSVAYLGLVPVPATAAAEAGTGRSIYHYWSLSIYLPTRAQYIRWLIVTTDSLYRLSVLNSGAFLCTTWLFHHCFQISISKSTAHLLAVQIDLIFDFQLPPFGLSVCVC
ncbi:Uncharacterized protein HZ326_26953, partial [Fusarium oxysporum f. sp. albedinis]